MLVSSNGIINFYLKIAADTSFIVLFDELHLSSSISQWLPQNVLEKML